MNKNKIMEDYYLAISNEVYHRKNMELSQEKIKIYAEFLGIKNKLNKDIKTKKK